MTFPRYNTVLPQWAQDLLHQARKVDARKSKSLAREAAMADAYERIQRALPHKFQSSK